LPGLLTLLTLPLAACASQSGLLNPGSSDVAPSAQSRSITAVPAATDQWPHLRALDPTTLESRGFTRMEATPVASKGHHPPDWTGIVSIDNDGAPLYRNLRPGTTLPEGTVIAESHTLANGEAGPIFAMAKTNGAWTFSVVAPDGHIEEQGEIPTCARCHGESPHDSVFGPRGEPKEQALEPEKDEGLAPEETSGPAGKPKKGGSSKRR
jgi:hypothetical protein